MTIDIRPARVPEDMDAARVLFREYQEWLAEDLCFQDFEAELAGLPGKYAEPDGAILLAWDGDRLAGGVALWPLEDGDCEMKRLYVRPDWLGRGLGRRLAEDIVAAARARGYAKMKLDTLSRLTAATTLYESMGFVDTRAYYENPLNGVMYLELAL